MNFIIKLSLLLFIFPILASEEDKPKHTHPTTSTSAALAPASDATQERTTKLVNGLLQAKPTAGIRKALKAVLESPRDQQNDNILENVIRQKLTNDPSFLFPLTQVEEFGSWFYAHLIGHVIYGKPERQLAEHNVVARFDLSRATRGPGGMLSMVFNPEDAYESLAFNDQSLANSIAFAPWVFEKMPFVLEKWQEALTRAICEEKNPDAISNLKSRIWNGPKPTERKHIFWRKEGSGYALRDPIPSILITLSTDPAFDYEAFHRICGQMAGHGQQLQSMIEKIAGKPSKK